jgi:hypothetical protein
VQRKRSGLIVVVLRESLASILAVRVHLPFNNIYLVLIVHGQLLLEQIGDGSGDGGNATGRSRFLVGKFLRWYVSRSKADRCLVQLRLRYVGSAMVCCW